MLLTALEIDNSFLEWGTGIVRSPWKDCGLISLSKQCCTPDAVLSALSFEQEAASNWAAQRVRDSHFAAEFDAVRSAREGRPVYFTGEVSPSRSRLNAETVSLG